MKFIILNIIRKGVETGLHKFIGGIIIGILTAIIFFAASSFKAVYGYPDVCTKIQVLECKTDKIKDTIYQHCQDQKVQEEKQSGVNNLINAKLDIVLIKLGADPSKISK